MNAENGMGDDLTREERIAKVIAEAPVSVRGILKRAFHGASISREAGA